MPEPAAFLRWPWVDTQGFFSCNMENYIPMDDETYLDDVEYYDELYNSPRRQRKAQRNPKRKPTTPISSIVEPTGTEAGFVISYQPARFEAGWLVDSLKIFFDQHLINDILANIKGGKEASVYRCAADPTTGETLLAAKVYRPRMFRNLSNDRMYRDGRAILTAEGRPVKANDHRLMRAIGKKTATGVQVSHTSWLMYEYNTLRRLHALGAAVPRPLAVHENALLMGYVGNERMAAPTLNGVTLPRAEARRLFDETLRNIELMLSIGLIHGDLSAYNMLYWEGAIVLIDFPQVTYSRTNTQAYQIFARDIRRVCEYFARQGVQCAPEAIITDLWERYARIDPLDVLADASVLFNQSVDDMEDDELSP